MPQEDLEIDLNKLEEQLEKELLALRDQDASQDDLDREEMYARAEDLDQHLGGMESTLKKIVHDYNHARQPPSSSSSSSGQTGRTD